MSDAPRDQNLVGELLARLSASGEQAFNELAARLADNPLFMKALSQGLAARNQVDRSIRGAMDFASLPSRNDVEQILERLDAISTRLARLERRLDETLDRPAPGGGV